MARPGIEKDAVFEAAAGLQAEGLRATVQNVRDRVGSGSFSTISAYLSEWKATQVQGQAPAVPEVPDRVQTAFKQVWATAAQDAEARLVKEREAMDAVQRELAVEKTELAAEIERLEGLLEKQARAAEISTAEHDELKEAFLTIQEENTALKIENTKITEQVKAQTARSEEMNHRLVQLDTQFTQRQEALENVRRDLGDMVTEKAELASEIKRLEGALNEQTQRAKANAAERDESREAAQAAQQENTRLEEQVKAQTARGDEMAGRLDQLQAEFTNALKTVAEQPASKQASQS